MARGVPLRRQREVGTRNSCWPVRQDNTSSKLLKIQQSSLALVVQLANSVAGFSKPSNAATKVWCFHFAQ